jgi:hypothetical protein
VTVPSKVRGVSRGGFATTTGNSVTEILLVSLEVTTFD